MDYTVGINSHSDRTAEPASGASSLREIRVFGPPGCGKTTKTKELVIHSCQEFGSDAVTVCAFTRTAARELVSRNLPVDPRRIGTVHALVFRELGHPKLIADKASLEQWNQANPGYLMRGGVNSVSALDDPYLDFDAKGDGEGDGLLQEANRLRGLMIPVEAWQDSVREFYGAWTAYKELNSLLDFTDLIEHAIKIDLPPPDGTRALFVDETQDLSPLELTLIRQWGAHCDVLYIAGDDDQCLYRFKGSTPNAFLFPPLPPEQIIVLDQSYRVPRAVHAVACKISQQIKTRQEKAYKPRPYDGHVRYMDDVTYQYPISLKDRLLAWIKAGKTAAILGTCSYMLDPIKKELREWGIPFHNPYRRIRGDWNPLQGREGSMSAAKRLLAFLKVSRNKGWWTYADLWAWAAELDAKSIFSHGGKTEIRRMAEREEMATVPVAEEHLEEWIVDAHAPIAAAKGDLDWYRERLLKSSVKPMTYVCQIVQEQGAEALESEPRVILGTVHSVKGGEADCVVLYPDLSKSAYEEFTSEDADAEDSIHRVFYVGVTRAKEDLYITAPSNNYLYYPMEQYL